MARRLFSGLLASVLAVISAGPPPAFGSGEPQQSFLYRNFVRASEVLDRATAALGGAGLLDSLNVRLSFTGTYRDENHLARPWAHVDYRLEGTTFYSADLKAIKSEVTFHEGERSIPTFAILGPMNGLKLNGGRSRPDSIPAEELESSRREELEILPQEYLREARSAAAGLRLLPGPRGHHVLTYTLDNGESRALFLDATTHLLVRVERIGHWKHKGDRLEWRTFDRYVDRNGIRVPLHSEVHAEGTSTQHDVITDITEIEFGGATSAEEFAIPAESRTGLDGWTLQKPKVKNPDQRLPCTDLGNGAFIIDLPPSDARSLIVAFSDFSVVVEAGDYSEISARLLATADSLLPDKPVRYVAMTHHHPLYANGIRPYVQRGITVLTTAGNVPYLRDLATRPYRIHPDEQQRHPRDPKFEVIRGSRILEDGAQRLEFFEFDYSTHVDEFVLAYLPSHRLIVTGDLVYILRDSEPRPANSRELAVYRLVKERKLDVQNIMQTWFLARADRLVPFSVLEEKVRLAQAKTPQR